MTVPDAPTTDFPPKLGKPAERALEHAGYTALDQLTAVRERDLAKLHGMGPKALGRLREALAAQGKAFAAA
jgi:predicted flap endonuclease-1-like 5' DNA nuclease